MEKRILIPTDFSKNALNAIRYALGLYEDLECDIYLLNVYQVDGYRLENAMMVPEPGERAFEEAKTTSERQFKKLLMALRLLSVNTKNSFHTISTFNSLLEAIEDVVAKKDIDIIVMGTKGSTGSRSVIFGTNAINIMEKVTDCPVMAIPENAQFSPPNEIVFPTDYKTVFKRNKLRHMLSIAKRHRSAIRVLHVQNRAGLGKRQQDNKYLLEEILMGVESSFHTLSKVSVIRGVQTFIKSRNSGMIAFLNKKHLFFGSILSNPMVKEVGYDSEIPILVLKDNS